MTTILNRLMLASIFIFAGIAAGLAIDGTNPRAAATASIACLGTILLCREEQRRLL